MSKRAAKPKAKKKPAKKREARSDYTQSALATVLKLTGSKSLTEPKVERVDFRKI